MTRHMSLRPTPCPFLVFRGNRKPIAPSVREPRARTRRSFTGAVAEIGQRTPPALRAITCLFALLATVLAQGQVNISPLTTFGNQGWLSPNGVNGSTYAYLTTGDTERGLAYGNNHLYLASRNGGDFIRILDPQTGADLGALNLGTGVVSGGTFDINMVAVDGDGAIYVGNLAIGPDPFRVYRWANDLSTTTPTVVYSNVPLPGARVGDSLAAMGSGSATRLAAGFNSIPAVAGDNGYTILDPTAGTAAVVSFNGSPPNAGDFRLALTFIDPSHVAGTQGGGSSPFLYTSFSGSSGTVVGAASLASTDERPMSFAVVAGVPLLATVSTTDNHVSLYALTNPAQPVLVGQANATTGALPADSHSTGAVAWGKVSGNTATLYVMATDDGIQAFNVTVPAPAPAAITRQPQNQTVLELAPATFSVGTTGNPAPACQWYRGGSAVGGATNSNYTIDSAAYTDNGAQFDVMVQNIVSNVTYAVTSSVVSLTVIADTNPPVLLGAQALGLSQVQVSFSERLTPASATNVANYTLSSTNGPVTINSATLDFSQTNVLLATSALTDGGLYILTVNNLTDQSHAANVMASNSQAQFESGSYVMLAIGNPQPPGSQVAAGNGYNISAGGAGVGGTNDQGTFSYQSRSGDFDLEVRLDSLGLADAWSEAGLVVREDLSAGARFAGVLATPSISGAFFEWRGATNGAASRSGSLPVNYPNLWLRLKRTGNVFSGFGSVDGANWAALGSVSLSFGPDAYFGFVVSSGNTNQVSTAAFRDFGPVTSVGTGVLPQVEGLGQGSRTTSLVISEIMYHPTNASLEYVELFNSRGEPQDLSGYQLGGNIAYTFPAGSVIAGGGFVVVGADPGSLQNAYGISNVYGPYAGHLPGKGGTLSLTSQGGGLLLEVNYGTSAPWPVSPDGAGHSLVLARPSYGVANVLAWAASDAVGGSPGRLDPVTLDPLRHVVINELLVRPDPPDAAYLELYNHSSQPVDISGCVLTDNALSNRFVVPAGTLIAAHGFVSYGESNLNFVLNAAGETVYFQDPAQRRVLDAVRFGGQEQGVAWGRYPDGGDHFYRLAVKSPGAANGPIRLGDIVINEIMYAPVSLNDDDQYVELYNRSGQAVDVGGWQFVSGISFTFPTNQVIPPDGYLVVARNAARLQANYPNLNSGNLIGNFGGTLAHKGEQLTLAKPDTVLVTNSLGVVQTNAISVVVNEVTYGVGGRWGEWSHAGGSSLELIDPNADNTLAPNWADSDETHKAPWTIVSATGTIDNGDVTADELQVLVQGVGEALIDNVQVIDSSGQNRIANGTFEAGAGGWTAEGTEKTSTLETTEGYNNSSQSYHVRAVEKADNQVNRVHTPLTSALAAGSANVTIRAAVRWLKGDPEILLRLRGNWLECAAELPTSANLGTPGMRNSRSISNAPPAIVGVNHSPILPQTSQPIVVTAQVTDPDGVSAVVLKYRLDPASTYTSVPMTDDGSGGDVVAGDGKYSATIPGQAAGTMIAFYVQATDRAAAPATSTFPNDAPVRECLVRVGEVQPTGNYPVYRVWMTQATYNTWNSNPKLDNTYYDVTFVLGDKRVIYNAAARYKGSPYISPGYCGPSCGRCGYSLSFPTDDQFLADEELVIDWPGGHGGETTALQEQMCYWIADRLNLPWSHRHTIRLHINGVTDEMRQATFEAVVQPAGGFVGEWSPGDTSGELFKIERAFEFNDSDGLVADPEPRLQPYTTTGGVKKREHYRWNFMFRTTDRRDDYTNIFALVDAVNAAAPEPYTSGTLGLVDMEEWMGIFATEHIIENFDAYGHEIGKNMYAYLAPSGKWQLYLFDLDWAMLAAPIYSSIYTASAGPLFNAEDPTITRMFGFAPFVRAYWRAVQNAVNGPFDPANCNPVIDAKSRSLFANGIQWCDGQPLTGAAQVKTWFSQRRAALQGQLATVASPFGVRSVVLSNNVALVSGTAPVEVQNIWFNGAQWPVLWTSVTNWMATVVLQPGTNQWNVVGMNPQGQPVAGASNLVNAVYSGPVPSPAGQVVMNEIMYNPSLAGAQYVELSNNSSNLSFDLSGWRFQGLGYTFPAGALLGPNRYLVLAANRVAFAAAYGATNLVFDTFSGTLQPEGETLTLLAPNTNGSPGSVVAKVRYSSHMPWPTPANTPGSSLQLIDTHQDNWRVGNWAASLGASSNGLGAQWTYFAVTGTAASSRLNLYLQQPGLAYIDDLELVAGAVPQSGANLLTNGDFELPLAGSWNLGADFDASSLVSNVVHSGTWSLQVANTGAGSGSGDPIYQDITPALTPGQTYTLSFWYLQTAAPHAPVLTIELSGSGLSSGPINTSLGGAGQVFAPATPGAANGSVAVLPPFPPLWINEVQADDRTGITTRAGGRSGWLELYNPSPNVVPLGGLYLSTNYNDLSGWSFPEGTAINPSEFKIIFADGQADLSTSNELHTSFTLGRSSGSLALTRVLQGQPQVLDYLDYTNLAPDHSYGSVPDGQSFDRQEMALATPGAPNTATNPPSFIGYNTAGWLYSQDFDALPDPGLNSVNTANPVTIDGMTYALGDPFDFAASVQASGSGGLGLIGLSGWYGLGSVGSKFGATDGDQTTGGVISFGAPAGSNRALGLLATSSTGGTAFGAKFINQTGRTLNYLSLQFTGELWRQSDLAKSLEFHYFIDPSGTAPFSTSMSALIPSLNVSFATSAAAVGGVAVDGTAAVNQTNLAVVNLAITNWFPGGALWLVWEMANPAGKSQGVAIDNVLFSASDQPLGDLDPVLSAQVLGPAFVISWPTLPGYEYQIEYKDDLNTASWVALGPLVTGTGTPLALTNNLTFPAQRFYRLRVIP